MNGAIGLLIDAAAISCSASLAINKGDFTMWILIAALIFVLVVFGLMCAEEGDAH